MTTKKASGQNEELCISRISLSFFLKGMAAGSCPETALCCSAAILSTRREQSYSQLMAIVHDEFAMGGVVPLLFNPPVGLMEAVFGLSLCEAVKTGPG